MWARFFVCEKDLYSFIYIYMKIYPCRLVKHGFSPAVHREAAQLFALFSQLVIAASQQFILLWYMRIAEDSPTKNVFQPTKMLMEIGDINWTYDGIIHIYICTPKIVF